MAISYLLEATTHASSQRKLTRHQCDQVKSPKNTEGLLTWPNVVRDFRLVEHSLIHEIMASCVFLIVRRVSLKINFPSKAANAQNRAQTRDAINSKSKTLRISSLSKILFRPIVLATAILGCGLFAGAQKHQDLGNRNPGSIGFTEEELEKSVPPARPEDVASPEAIVRALHDSVSGPKGDWKSDRFRSLCLPNVFFANMERNEEGAPLFASISMDNIVKIFTKVHHESGWYEGVGEMSTVKIVKADGYSLASVTYIAGEGKDPNHKMAEKPNTITDVMYIGKRWWVVSHYW